MTVDQSVFDDVPLFSLLDAEERTVLAQHVVVREFASGTPLYEAGQSQGRAYVVQRGRVKVTIDDADGNAIVLELAEAGAFIGYTSMLADVPHMTDAVALEDTRAIEIDREDLQLLLQKRPLAGLDILTMAAQQLRGAQLLLRTRASRDANTVIDARETLGERVADGVARFGGSWTFVIAFGVVLVTYTAINTLLGNRAWDPYPFILLNLFLSMLAAIQAPVIMMSQNRQDAKDRVRSELDYKVNLKAETEITHLLERVGRIESLLLESRKR